MKLNDKYEMVNLIVDPEIMRLVSREVGSQRPVVIHLMLRGYTDENKQLLNKLSRAGPEFRRHIVETGEYEHVPCVITEYFSESLREWLSTIPNESGSENDNAAAKHDDDFKLIFEQPGMPEANTTPSQAELRKLGEFTMLFQNSAPVSSPESKEAVPDGAGDFTKLFKVPSLNRRQSGSEPVNKVQEVAEIEGKLPGDFTAQFRPTGLPPEAPASSAAPPQRLERAGKSSNFGEEFGRELRPPRSEDAKKRRNPLDVVEGWQGMDPRRREERVVPAVPSPARIPNLSSAPVADPLPPIILPTRRPAGGRRSYLPLIVVLGCLLATAILVVVYFVVMQGR